MDLRMIKDDIKELEQTQDPDRMMALYARIEHAAGVLKDIYRQVKEDEQNG